MVKVALAGVTRLGVFPQSKRWRLESQAGCTPGLRFCPLLWALMRGNLPMALSHIRISLPFCLPPFPSLSNQSINKNLYWKRHLIFKKWSRWPWLVWLPVWLSWLEHCPEHQKAGGLIPGQGTYLSCGFNTWSWRAWEATNWCFSLSLSVSLSLPLCLKSINIFFLKNG